MLKEYDEEMCWLAELFPLELREASQSFAEERLGAWCEAHPRDARALRYLGDLLEDDVMMKKAPQWATFGRWLRSHWLLFLFLLPCHFLPSSLSYVVAFLLSFSTHFSDARLEIRIFHFLESKDCAFHLPWRER